MKLVEEYRSMDSVAVNAVTVRDTVGEDVDEESTAHQTYGLASSIARGDLLLVRRRDRSRPHKHN